jgi:hypothetical protein
MELAGVCVVERAEVFEDRFDPDPAARQVVVMMKCKGCFHA